MRNLFLSLDSAVGGSVRCRFHTSGCPYSLPDMTFHEEKLCQYRPTRCPSLTCPEKPAYAKVMQHIKVSFVMICGTWNILSRSILFQEQHNGTVRGRDKICQNASNQLISSYVNIDKEPIFYKNSRLLLLASFFFLFFFSCFILYEKLCMQQVKCPIFRVIGRLELFLSERAHSLANEMASLSLSLP